MPSRRSAEFRGISNALRPVTASLGRVTQTTGSSSAPFIRRAASGGTAPPLYATQRRDSHTRMRSFVRVGRSCPHAGKIGGARVRLLCLRNFRLDAGTHLYVTLRLHFR